MARGLEVQHAIAHARDIVKEFQHASSSVDVVGLAHSLGIDVVEPAEMGPDGYLGRRHDGALVIRYRAQNGGNRNRFTIAHEIAHLLLSKAQGKDIALPDAGYVRDADEETAVNRIAAELLMPVAGVSTELANRERRGEMPSWRMIGALARQYQVSTTAMAFRVLELPGVNAISLRITIDGCGPKFPFDRSEHSPIRLVNGVEYEMERLWCDARKSARHTVPVRINDDIVQLHCEGSVRSTSTRLMTVRQYWVIGWKHVVSHCDAIRSPTRT
jgi:hypothetical protein